MGLVIMLLCCWGSGALFYGIGMWADRLKKPMHFWAGTEVDPKTVRDIPGYNHANAVMWKLYSIPYWIAGLCSFFSNALAGIVLMLACIPGLAFLFRQYHKIEKEFMQKP